MEKMKENHLINEFILFFAGLSERDFQYYLEFFIQNKVHVEIADIIDHYKRLDQKYDLLATKAFLKALELRELYI